ncbi:MAG: lipolytic protein family [Bacteroidetes bacterium]|nr:lipolytic protein family [Bacteroidota bacterium]
MKPTDHRTERRWAAASGIAVITIILLEVVLRIGGWYYTYTEKMDGIYRSYYYQKMPTWYWRAQPYDSLIITKPEYSHRDKANNYGFRDADFDTVNNRHGVKALVLGDSFVQGLGAPKDSTWPGLFETMLNTADSGRYRIYNCGAAGSDPFFEYVLLRDKLLKLKPDVVIMSINYSDINDYITRGGMERFRPDGTTVFAKGPWFEPLYKRSHLARMLLHFVLRYDFSLLSPWAHKGRVAEALNRLTDCADSTRRVCAEHQVKFLVVLHPYIDPYDRYLKRQDQLPAMEGMLRDRGVAVVNLFDDFGKVITEANYATYSWRRDMHYTSRGYALFASFLKKETEAKYPAYLKPEDQSIKSKGGN